MQARHTGQLALAANLIDGFIPSAAAYFGAPRLIRMRTFAFAPPISALGITQDGTCAAPEVRKTVEMLDTRTRSGRNRGLTYLAIILSLICETRANDAFERKLLQDRRNVIEEAAKSDDLEYLRRLRKEELDILRLSQVSTPRSVASGQENVRILEAAIRRVVIAEREKEGEREDERDRAERENKKLTPDDRKKMVMPDDVREKLTPKKKEDLTSDEKKRLSLMQQLAGKVEQEGLDTATKQAIKRIFGEAASKVAGGLFTLNSAIEPVEAADGTMAAQVKRWRNRCENFIKQEERRREQIEYYAKSAKEFNRRAANARSRYEARVLLDASETAIAKGREELATYQDNARAVDWCTDALRPMEKYIDSLE